MDQLKDKILSSFIVFENDLNGEAKTPVHKIRQQAMKVFEEKGFPTKREEEWKYTNLKPILKHDYKMFPASDEEAIEFKDVKKYFLHDIDTYKLVFVDGVYSSWLSQTTHREYDICTFASALKKFTPIMDEYFSKAAPQEEPMVAVNTAFAKEGAFIHVPRNKAVSKPIEIIFFTTGHDREVMTQPRNLIVLEENASAQVIERHHSLGENPVLTNSVSEIFLNRNAQLDYYKVQNDNTDASLIDNTTVRQKKDSVSRFGTFSFGGRFTRNNLNFLLDEENTEANLDGVTIISGKQFTDHHTLVDHKVPNCRSNELYKGIYDDRAHGVFNGKVVVHPHAQKTNAFQENNNILLSEKAHIDTKPQLEIFADDVSCSHGCTIGQLEEDSLFYLQSRGIPKKEAQALLMYAFSNAALKNVRIGELKKRLNYLIAKKLNVDIDFEL